ENSSGVTNAAVRSVWQRLSKEQDAILIDVRTRAEWNYVGVPDLSSIGKTLLAVEWQGFPDGRQNEAFVEQLTGALKEMGATKDTELFFICRSGARSMAAAQAMTREGYSRCVNVADGFEGPLDDTRHRGSLGGWKAADLPWVQG
ncbi:MAG: rhodanese-like domain-containing protein, partial [Hyphomicrobiaceae bacterium]